MIARTSGRSCSALVFSFLLLGGIFSGDAPNVLAQTATLTSFGASTVDTYTGLILAGDGNYYGVSTGGAAADWGCNDNPDNNCTYIDKITPSGTVTQLYTFEIAPGDTTTPYNANPITEGSDGAFYGTTLQGGTAGYGTIFRLTNYGVFTVLYNFPGDPTNGPTYGYSPGPLILGEDGNFYGIAKTDTGIVFFSMTTGGLVTILHQSETTDGIIYEDSGSLLQGSDGNFYTNTSAGFLQITPSGQITNIYPYPAIAAQLSGPTGPLVEGSDFNYYATSPYTTIDPNTGGGGDGAVYKLSTLGTMQTLYTLSGGTDGYRLNPDLTVGGDGNLYGTTYLGGNPGCPSNFGVLGLPGCGTIFEIGNSGGFHSLYSFQGTAVDGGRPIGQLVQGGNGDLYGTTFANYGNGTFDLAITPSVPAPIQLSFDPATVSPGTPTVLTWNVLNAFSRTMRQCHATIQGYPSGAGQWSGAQLGFFPNNGNVYSGTATITPTALGTYVYSLTCGGRESGFATLVVNDQLNVPAVLPSGLVSAVYAEPLDEFNGVPPYTTTVTGGTLPPGLMLNPASGVLQGTPTQFGTYTFSLQVTDSDSPQQTVSGTTSLTIKSSLAITTAALPNGRVGSKYSQTLAATGGIPPYAWSLTGGTLPDGITFTPSTGAFSGTPTKEETQNITLQVVDSEGTPATTSVSLPFVIKPPSPIAGVEFTQSIQQYQSLDDLNASLTANNEPPVPIIANKPAVMRVYFTGVSEVETYTVQVTGAVNGTKTNSLAPGCPPANQRAGVGPCTSTDFYFTPPVGSWTAVLTVTDSSGDVLDTETFTITSRTTQSILLKGVSVSNTNPGGQDPSVLLGMTYMLGAMMPTPQPVNVQITGQRVFLSSSNYLDMTEWESDVLGKIGPLYKPADKAADAAGNQRTDYAGVYSNLADPNGQATSFYQGHAVVIPNANNRLGDANGVLLTLAHEVGHTLGMVHTGIGTPMANVAPGCWAAGALSPGTTLASAAWPYSSNNIQSSAGLEYGFNVITETIVDPNNTFDIMSYCDPRWISPFNYKVAIAGLNGGAVASPSSKSSPGAPSAEAAAAPSAAPTLVQGSYLQVSGSIQNGVASLNPIFTQTIEGSTDPGSGTYSIQEQNASGQVLYTRYFTPLFNGTEAVGGDDYFSNPEFSEWIPVTAGTAAIVVLDPDANVLASQPLTGSAPIVTITSPASGFAGSGQQTISWTIQSSAPTLTSRIFYSADTGNTWEQIDETTATSDALDFSTLPGATAALLRIDVSDGVNTGSATSIPFNVSKKVPSAIVINAPLNGAVQPAANPLYLSGAAYDVDDGVLSGTALQWTDDIQGALGSGSFLPVNLQPGTHTLTLTATDSDGNAITATTTITLGGGPPIISLAATTLSANCLSATIGATPGVQGASLSVVQYSLDGGNTYVSIPLAQLPYSFQVPGTGSVTLIAAATDASGQATAQSTVLNLGTGCAVTPPVELTPTVTVTPSPTSITTAQALMVTVGVSGGSGSPTPTGSVTLSSGSYTSAATTLVSGSAMITVPAGSLAASTDTLTATYTPDAASSSTYNGAMGSNSVTVTAATAQIIVSTVPAGLSFSVDGTSYTATQTFNWTVGSSHTIATTSPQTSAGTQSTFSSWSDAGAISHSVTAPASATSYTATFTSSYQLTTTANPTAGGSVTPASGTYYASGTVVNLSATPNSGYSFTSWTGSVASAGSASTTITMSAPESVAANFASVATPTFTVSSSTTAQTVQPGGSAMFSITVAPQNGAFTSAVSLAASGLPAGATATFGPPSLTPGSSPASSTLTIQTAKTSAAMARRPSPWPLAGPLLALIGFCFLPGRRRRRWITLFVLLLTSLGAFSALTSCGGGFGQGASATSYTITVTGSSGSAQQSTTVQLTVE